VSLVTDFFLRLIGSSPEQREAEDEFRRSLRRHEESDAALDSILDNLKSINTRAQKQVDLTRTLLPFAVPKRDDTPTKAGTG
jgi:hypothetical protein